MRIVIGTRGSELALVQANSVKSMLQAMYAERGLVCELSVIKTAGDIDQKKNLGEIGTVGVFTRQIEKALLAGDIDLAVHSYKDLPAVLHEGLTIVAVPVREEAGDVIVVGHTMPEKQKGATYGSGANESCVGVMGLPCGAKVLTGSVRRKAQLLHMRSDLQVVGVRGNIHTRLRKLDESGADAMILAAAGLNRLGLSERITERLGVWDFIPACGQGALALECRVGDGDTIALVRGLNDDASRVSVEAERSYLRAMGAGCSMPIGAYARVLADEVHLKAMWASEDGSKMVMVQVSGTRQQYEEIGIKAAELILQRRDSGE